MTTEEFIADANRSLNGQPFKVLFGEIMIEDGVVELTSSYPISKGMKVLIGFDRILYPKNLVEGGNGTIYIAINPEGLFQAEYHDFIKTLGHPTNYKDLLSVNVSPLVKGRLNYELFFINGHDKGEKVAES